jgi:hypothetical protein
MSQVVTGEVDVFARVEDVDGGRVAKHMHVTAIGWQACLGRVEAEEILNPPLLEPAPEASEERLCVVPAAFRAAIKKLR